MRGPHAQPGGEGGRPAHPRGARGAFTLIELLVVISIIALLMAILMPSLAHARSLARNVKCLSNLHHLVLAAHTYTNENDDYFPIAYYSKMGANPALYAWDFTTRKDWSTRPATVTVEPGVLWGGRGVDQIHQCPSFRGKSNWLEDPATGYNYNTSYIGHGDGEVVKIPARVEDVQNPAECALFGDGQLSSTGQGGANKFMRSPWQHEGDEFTSRSAGAQGFRHLGWTNVGFADGHTQSWTKRYTKTYDYEYDADGNLPEDIGFLSEDNSRYDLE